MKTFYKGCLWYNFKMFNIEWSLTLCVSSLNFNEKRNLKKKVLEVEDLVQALLTLIYLRLINY